jgi:hypothetical protein
MRESMGVFFITLPLLGMFAIGFVIDPVVTLVSSGIISCVVASIWVGFYLLAN